MPEKRQPLGRGLSSLISTNLPNQSKPIRAQTTIDINLIDPDQSQPRQYFDDSTINELAQSIKNYGVLQPLLVKKAAQGRFRVIAGERRLKAAKIANLSQVPVIIKELTNDEVLEVALIENIQRQDLTLIEEAKSYQKLLQSKNYTQEQLAKKIGKSRSHLTNLIRLLQLPTDIQEKINAGVVSFGHARAIVNSENPMHIIQKIEEGNLTVRETENLVKKGRQTNDNKTNKSKRLGNDDSMFHELPKTEEVLELEQLIGKAIGLSVSIVSSHGKGKVIIHFNNSTELDAIMAAIG